MVNRNAKNGYKIVKKDHINVACELSSNRLQAVQSQPENHMSNACTRKDDFSGETIRHQPS